MKRLRAAKDLPAGVQVLNQLYFVIAVGRKASMLVVERPLDDSGAFRFYTFEEFKKRFSTIMVTDPGTNKRISLGAAYLIDPGRRFLPGRLVFRPPGSPQDWQPDDDFNTWGGFAVTPQPGDWSLFRAHLFENVCQGNQDDCTYLLNFLAHMAQRPGELPMVAVCLWSRDEGTGKTLCVELVAGMFRPAQFVTASSPDQLVGRFTGHLSDVIVLLADEANLATDDKAIGRLHSLITDRERLVERKGVDSYMEASYLRVFIASNRMAFIPAQADARRYFVLEVGSGRKRDTAYFGQIVAQMKNGGTAAMLHDLLQRDIGGVDLVRDLPRTEALRQQQRLSRSPIEAWWADYLDEATNATWNPTPKKTGLLAKAVDHLRAHQPGARSSGEALSYFLKGVYGPGVLGSRVRTPGGQVSVYHLPPLDEARHRFDPQRWPLVGTAARPASPVRAGRHVDERTESTERTSFIPKIRRRDQGQRRSGE